jgi:hypothetical protein
MNARIVRLFSNLLRVIAAFTVVTELLLAHQFKKMGAVEMIVAVNFHQQN